MRGNEVLVKYYDGKTGGSWHIAEKDPEGNEYDFCGSYHEVATNERIIWTFEFLGMPERGHVSIERMDFVKVDDSTTEIHYHSTFMSLKAAAVDIPMGGGKGGVAFDPRTVTDQELEEISRQYVRHLHPHIGPDQDVPAPDVNTNAQIIDWMVDEYEKLTGDTTKASFTGKSIANGGSLGREAATGRGGVVVLSELLRLHQDNRKIRYAIQGFGNVGLFFGTVVQAEHPDWVLVAASDSEATVHCDKGLDPTKLQAYKSARGRFKDYEDTDVNIISNDELLTLDVDVLVLAGFEETVTVDNVNTLRADYIVEMANGPVTNEAQEILAKDKTVVIPDIIANAGGVIVSYLEWLQNKDNTSWTELDVNARMATYLTKAIQDAYEYAKQYELTLNEAAFAIAITRLINIAEKNETV